MTVPDRRRPDEFYPVGVMFAVQVIFCAILVLAGLALLLLGWLGLRGQLPLNRYVGIRTAATLRSEDAFEIGNRAAAPAILAAGAIGSLSGLALPFLPSFSSVMLVATIGLIGGFALMTAGGVIGNRVAEAMPERSSGGCTGCAGGCCGALPRG
jgi:hypothetical protein